MNGRIARLAVLFLSLSAAQAAAASASEPGSGGTRLEPFLARLAAGNEAKAVPPAPPFIAWDEEEAVRLRARVLLLREPEFDWRELRAACEGLSPSMEWEGEGREVAQAVIAWRDLPVIAELPGLRYLFRPPAGVPCAEVETEGLAGMLVPEFREACPGCAGVGSRIAILDKGFADYERFVGTELPEDLVVRSFFDSPEGNGDIGGGGEDHGVACAEIVHDIAPGARLYLVNVNTVLDLEKAVDWLIEEHVSVISHSLGWYFGNLEGIGPINDIADRAARSDILWVNSSGNEAERHTWTRWRDEDGDGSLEFDAAGDERLDFANLRTGQDLVLILLWDEWPIASATDLTLELVDEGDQVLASSEAYPFAYRYLAWTSTDGRPVAARVRRARGNMGSRAVHVFRVGSGVTMEEHARPDRSLLVPSDSPSVIAVGATYWMDETLDSYSSRGATDGSGPVKPELCAPVGVSTAIYGGGGFRGTSAAAPHVAGAAGLLVSSGIRGGFRDLQWTREELVTLLSKAAKPPSQINPPITPLAWGIVRLPTPAPAALRRAPTLLGNPTSGSVGWIGPCRDALILDCAGRAVARGRDGRWDGRDLGGRQAAPGIYWLSCDGSAAARIVWMGR
ncbi:MAG: hypothetical protein FJY88_04620 [Candidatus Eisenbacteria bacterium]|nr:hypothetical protein [Candidatus Eisenbacteria bacterium]